jgi:hypothetical protein
MRKSAALFPIVFALGATIVAGPGAQAAPTAITGCQTISQSGSYVVANNLFNINFGATCLIITANDVTIDLAGFSIAADPRRGAGIQAVAPSSGHLQGIAVRNGASTVDLDSADLSIVEGLRVNCGFPLPIGNGIIARGIVKGNTVGASVGTTCSTGISATGTVTGNYVVNSRTGIKIGQWSTVIGNTATNNTEFGIVADCPSNLTDNTAVNNGTNLVLNGEGCHNEDNVAP